MKYLAFDLGAESGRAVLGTLKDGRLALEELHRFLNEPVQVGGTLHWDVLGQFRDMKKGLAKAVQAHGEDIAGIGVDTWGVDFGLIGKGGALLGNPVHYRDDRTNGILEKVFSIIPKEDVFGVTGTQFMQFNTIFQLYAMKSEGSPLLDIAESLLLMPDLFNYFLTGERTCEYSIASTTQLLDARTRSWSEGLISTLGLPRDILLPVVGPGTVVGEILPGIGNETGAKGVRIIAPAGHDTGSAVAAVPARGYDHAYISCGTWSLMGIEVPEPIINDLTSRYNFTNEGAVGGIRLLKNIMGLWLVQECRRAWQRAGEDLDYATLTAMAGSAEPMGSFVVPNDASFLKPSDMPEAIRDYCRKSGQPVPATKGAVIRCALESLALNYRWALERLREISGKGLSTVHMVGGGIQNRLLCQLAADSMGIPVIAGPIEATAIGNILVQAIAVGEVASLEEAREIIRDSFPVETYEPRPEYRSRWDEVYGRFADQME